jgi:Rieske Fe-S protein
MRMTDQTPSSIDRRHILAAGAVAAAGITTLAGCGSGNESAGSAPTPTEPSTSAATPESTTGAGGGGATPIVALADVPVGGAVSAKAADGKPLIVAQPSAGEAVAFSAICTHQGCTVAPRDDEIACPCHGSVYESATGKNVGGPAPRPLAKVEVTVVDGQVVPA